MRPSLPNGSFARITIVILGAAFVALLSACQPTFNWRELRLAEGTLQALMPCKPDTAERAVPLGKEDSQLHMASCRTGGITFAIAWTALPEGTDTVAALEKWQAASRQSLRAPAQQAWEGAPDMPQPATATVAMTGQDHEGHPIEARVVYLGKDMRLYQAAVYGAALPAETLDPFFSSLTVQP